MQEIDSISQFIAEPAARKKTKCLITGGAGFIGSNLVDALISRGNEVIVIDNLALGKRENVHSGAIFHELDITDFDSIKDIFADVDYVFHMAAMPRIQYSIDNPFHSHEVNVKGTLNVLIAAKEAGVRRLVYSASSSAYGPQEILPWVETMQTNPISPYGLQKYMGEIYCRLFSQIHGLQTVSLRYFNVYGPRQSDKGAYAPVMATFFKQILNGEELTVLGDGEQTRDYTHVADVVRANILAANSQRVGKGEVINIGRGHNRSINEVVEMMGGPKKYLPPRHEVKHSLADNRKAKELLNWEPVMNLEDWIIERKRELGLE